MRKPAATSNLTSSSTKSETSSEPATPMPAVEAAVVPEPGVGMVYQPWAGIDHWHCLKCSLSTFKEAEAKDHRC